MGIGGGGSGWVAHFRVWVSLAGFQPVKAMDLREEDGVFRNFSASLTTYLPMKPEAQGERGLWTYIGVLRFYFIFYFFFMWDPLKIHISKNIKN